MTGTGRISPGFWLVFAREFAWLRRRRFLLLLTTIIPLVLMATLMLAFSERLATHLPIAVLDLDGSEVSRQIVRSVSATPDVTVALRVTDLAGGKQAVSAGRIYGLLMLPKQLERDVFAGRRPEIVFFYNNQFMTAGGLALRGVANAVPAVESAIRVSLRTNRGVDDLAARQAITPIPVQLRPLFNPTFDYSHFLLAAVLPSVLQIIMVASTAYAAGLDLETSHRTRILGRLGNGIFPAMAGKILPYTVLFLLLLGLADFVLFSHFEMPLRGNRYLLVISGILFVLACQLLGLVFALFVQPAATAISLVTLVTSPAFGFMGVGFPRMSMGLFAYWWGAALPGTWYLQARIDQTLRGAPPDLSLQPILVLGAFVIGLGLLSMIKLEAIRRQNEARRSSAAPTGQAPCAGR